MGDSACHLADTCLSCGRVLDRLADRDGPCPLCGERLDGGTMTADLATAVASAAERPDDAAAQIAAAYANDRRGRDADAIGYYDAAWALGVPADERCDFMVGYGSTLRNVGRLEESMAIHRLAIAEFPHFVAHRAFLALALHARGRHDDALAEALTAVIDGADLDGYERALGDYRDELAR